VIVTLPLLAALILFIALARCGGCLGYVVEGVNAEVITKYATPIMAKGLFIMVFALLFLLGWVSL